MPRSLFRAIRRAWLGNPCDRCGRPGARLVIDAERTGKKIDGRSGLVTKTYAVRSCEWLCPGCRRGGPAA